MKCPNCGAEINNGKFCEFCGTQFSCEMLKEQEQASKRGCPKCGSTNVVFRREDQGEIIERNRRIVVRETVGLCNDCGCTWTTSEAPEKRKTWLWVLGWIFIFPVPLTILLLKKQEMKPALKYGIIIAAWLLYFLFGFYGEIGDNNASSSDTQAVEQTSVVSVMTESDSCPADESASAIME